MADIFTVPGIGTFSIETTSGVSVIRDAEDGEPWLTVSAFPHEHASALVAIVHHARTDHYDRGVRAGKLLVEGKIRSVVGLIANAWFEHAPERA